MLSNAAFEARQNEHVRLPDDLKMNCSIDPSSIIWEPSQENANKGLELLVNRQLKVECKIDHNGIILGGYYTFQFGEKLWQPLPCPYPVTVTISFRGQELFKHRFQP